MQSNILDQNPSEPISVLVVWFAVLGADSASQVDTGLMPDDRALHFWDTNGLVSAFMTEHAEQVGIEEIEGLWDGYLLFGPGATWEEFPAPLVDWEVPVATNIDRLSDHLEAIWVPTD